MKQLIAILIIVALVGCKPSTKHTKPSKGGGTTENALIEDHRKIDVKVNAPVGPVYVPPLTSRCRCCDGKHACKCSPGNCRCRCKQVNVQVETPGVKVNVEGTRK